MMVDGVPKLACMTFLRDYFPQPVRVEALAHFPIERDLVIVINDFSAKLESIKPYIIPDQPRALAAGEYLQTPAELDVFEKFSACINCLLCYAACPQYGLNSNFIGPGTMALVQAEEGVFNCTAVGYCSEVCPKKVDPANAVNVNKTEAAKDYFLRFIVPSASPIGTAK